MAGAPLPGSGRGGGFRAYTNVVTKRDNFGRFAAECEMAANSTVRKAIEKGATRSRRKAPGPGYNVKSYSKRPGYIPLKKSIRTQMVSRTKGYWYSMAPHAMHIEFGTSAHPISGQLVFWWAREGRWYIWNHWGYRHRTGTFNVADQKQTGSTVHHPGNKAQPFLRPSYDVTRAELMQIAKEEYPG